MARLKERFAFGSLHWYDAVAGIVRELLSGADLEGDYSFSEEFVDAPEHLERDARGRVGWHFVVSQGEVRTGFGPLDEADMAITAVLHVRAPTRGNRGRR
jgi:hypothetical protein